MKALTICQPYAHLICLPDDDARAKRVENRTWPTSYRGQLLIHAGKSRQWLAGDDEKYFGMVYGAILGIADLRDCVQLLPHNEKRNMVPLAADRRWPWLKFHEHTEGPWCWVLQEVRRFKEPIPYSGAQGLFDVPREVVETELQPDH